MGSLFLPVRTTGSVAIAICYRCQRKIYNDQLVQDRNNLNWYCEDCVDQFDPWRMAPRQTENISLRRPRPDTGIMVSLTDWDDATTVWDDTLTDWPS